MAKKSNILIISLFVISVLVQIGPLASKGLAAEPDNQLFTFFQADEFEVRSQDGDNLFAWDAQGWIGGDYSKFAFKTEGDRFTDGPTETAELQLLYKRLVSSFFDAQFGLRYDFKPDPSRTYAVFGVQGLAPQWFEVDASAFVSDEGDASARFEAEYELFITQRLVLQPSAETNLALSDDQEVGIASGFTDLELGLRLRYEIKREIAPYIGISWERKLGDTADLVRDEGDDPDVLSIVAGVRFFF